MKGMTAPGSGVRRGTVRRAILIAMVVCVAALLAAVGPAIVSPATAHAGEPVSPHEGDAGIVGVVCDPLVASSVATGALIVRTELLTPPEGLGPESFVARIEGPDGVVDVVGSAEGTLLADMTPGWYALVGQEGPADLVFIQSSNGPVLVPSGGTATLVITNAIPATSSISTEPTVTTVKGATTLAGTEIPVPSVIDAGGGGVGEETGTRASAQVQKVLLWALTGVVVAAVFLAKVLPVGVAADRHRVRMVSRTHR